VDLEVLRVAAAKERLRAVGRQRPARAVGLDFGFARVFQRVLGARKARHVRQRVLGGEHQVHGAARLALERLLRAQPEAGDQLGAVVRAVLPVRRQREEKTRVEAPRAPRRGDPVAEVGEVVRAQQQPLLFEELGEVELAGEEHAAELRELRHARRVQRMAVLALRQQDAGFLEAFAHRGHPVGDPARGDAEARVGFLFRQAVHAAQHARVLVGLVQRAAGKHVRAGEEGGALRALQEEGFGPQAAIAQQQHGGCRARNELVRHAQAARPARSLSFCDLMSSRALCQSASLILSSSVKEAPVAR